MYLDKKDLLTPKKKQEYMNLAIKIANEIDNVEKVYSALRRLSEDSSTKVHGMSIVIGNFTYKKRGEGPVHGETSNSVEGGIDCKIYATMENLNVEVFMHFYDSNKKEFARLDYVYDKKNFTIIKINAMGTKEIEESEKIK